jgi:hypothetical protein
MATAAAAAPSGLQLLCRLHPRAAVRATSSQVMEVSEDVDDKNVI